MKKNFYQEVAAANDGIVENDVKNIFIWYDLFGYAIPFLAIFILVYLTSFVYFPITMLSVIFIIIIDQIVKNSLDKDKKNYVKFRKHMSFIKLWTIPLIVMGMFAGVSMALACLGII